MKLSIVNNTNQYNDKDIYFGIIGEQSGRWGYINSNGSWQQAPPQSQKANVPFYRLSERGSINLSPPIISGRCWLSIGRPLVVPLWDSGFTGPAFNAEGDPNYSAIFDKFEFTYNTNKTIYCNTTSVDFFGMLITATLIGSKKQSVGTSAHRSDIFKAFQKTPPFNSLIRTANNTPLRILAPQKDAAFPKNYFNAYIDECWQKYRTQSLTLQPLPYNGATYISKGSVDGNNVFKFVTTPGNTIHTIPKPTSNDVFGCDGVFNPSGSGLSRIIDGDIKNQVSAALNRTILLNSNSSTWCDASKYYLNSTTNYYAKILHESSIDRKSYAFPYDDKCEQSSTLVDTNPTEIVLTLAAGDNNGGGGGGEPVWERFDLATSGSASVHSGVAAITRAANHMEVWWVGKNGSVQDAYWIKGEPWRRYELAPAGSASEQSGVAAITRSSNHMETWWIGENGSVQGAFWTTGKPWVRYEIAPAGSAAKQSGVTAITRSPNHMEVWWIGENGSVQGAYWIEGKPWVRYELGASGSASAGGGIAAVTRASSHIETLWVSDDSAVKGAFLSSL